MLAMDIVSSEVEYVCRILKISPDANLGRTAAMT